MAAWIVLFIWLVCLCVVTFIFWLRPASFFSRSGGSGFDQSVDRYLFLGTLLAVLLFVSCFALGVGLSVVELKGLIWE